MTSRNLFYGNFKRTRNYNQFTSFNTNDKNLSCITTTSSEQPLKKIIGLKDSDYPLTSNVTDSSSLSSNNDSNKMIVPKLSKECINILSTLKDQNTSTSPSKKQNISHSSLISPFPSATSLHNQPHSQLNPSPFQSSTPLSNPTHKQQLTQPSSQVTSSCTSTENQQPLTTITNPFLNNTNTNNAPSNSDTNVFPTSFINPFLSQSNAPTNYQSSLITNPFFSSSGDSTFAFTFNFSNKNTAFTKEDEGNTDEEGEDAYDPEKEVKIENKAQPISTNVIKETTVKAFKVEIKDFSVYDREINKYVKKGSGYVSFETFHQSKMNVCLLFRNSVGSLIYQGYITASLTKCDKNTKETNSLCLYFSCVLSETNDKKLKPNSLRVRFLNGNDLNKCYDKFNNIMEQLIKESTIKSNDNNSNTDNKVYHASLKLKKRSKQI